MAASDLCILLVEALCAEVVLLFEAIALVECLLVLAMPTKMSSLDKVHPSVGTAPHVQDMLLAEALLVVVVPQDNTPLASPPQTSPVSLI